MITQSFIFLLFICHLTKYQIPKRMKRLFHAVAHVGKRKVFDGTVEGAIPLHAARKTVSFLAEKRRTSRARMSLRLAEVGGTTTFCYAYDPSTDEVHRVSLKPKPNMLPDGARWGRGAETKGGGGWDDENGATDALLKDTDALLKEAAIDVTSCEGKSECMDQSVDREHALVHLRRDDLHLEGYFDPSTCKEEPSHMDNLGTCSSHAIMSTPRTTTEDGTAVKILPMGTAMFKGIDASCAHVNALTFAPTPSWFADYATAYRYGPLLPFAFRLTRDVMLLDITSKETMDMLLERMQAERGSGGRPDDPVLENQLLRVITALGYFPAAYHPNLHDTVAVQGHEPNVGGTGSVSFNIQRFVLEKIGARVDMCPYFTMPDETKVCNLNVFDGAEVLTSFGLGDGSFNRLSEVSSDRTMVEAIKAHFPDVDGYIAPEMPNLSQNVFHPEVCLFNPSATVARWSDHEMDMCTLEPEERLEIVDNFDGEVRVKKDRGRIGGQAVHGGSSAGRLHMQMMMQLKKPLARIFPDAREYANVREYNAFKAGLLSEPRLNEDLHESYDSDLLGGAGTRRARKDGRRRRPEALRSPSPHLLPPSSRCRAGRSSPGSVGVHHRRVHPPKHTQQIPIESRTPSVYHPGNLHAHKKRNTYTYVS